MPRRLSIVLALVLGLCGCAPRDTPVRGAKGGDGTLRLSFPGEPRTLNPNLGPAPDELAMIVGANIFNRLVSLATDGTLLPELATAWDESPDGLTYTFHLRSDVRWHDGRPFSSEDARMTLVRAMIESSNRDVASRMAGVTAPDDHTVVIRLKDPWAAFLPAFAWFGTSILPAHVYLDGSWLDHPANMAPIGTGPFKFARWDRGSRIVLEKNSEYFGPGPYVDEAEFLLTARPAEAVDRLVDGRADLLIGRPPAERLQALSLAPQLRVSTAPADGRSYLAFNFRRRPFDDVRVRRAINLAIDRRRLVNGPLAGLGIPAFGFYTPSVGWAYNGEARVPVHDIQAARRLLAEAAPGGVQATLLLPLGGSSQPLSQELARQLGTIGVRVDAQQVGADEYLRRLLQTHDFDLAMASGTQGPDPDSLAARFSSNGAFQFMGYSNPELDEVLARAGRESNVGVRARAYYRAQEILAADLPIAPLIESVRVTICRAGLRGLPHEDARGLAPEYTFNLVRLPGR